MYLYKYNVSQRLWETNSNFQSDQKHVKYFLNMIIRKSFSLYFNWCCEGCSLNASNDNNISSFQTRRKLTKNNLIKYKTAYNVAPLVSYQ